MPNLIGRMSCVLRRTWLIPALLVGACTDSMDFVSITAHLFNCDYRHPDTCYRAGQDEANYASGSAYLWHFGSLANVGLLGPEDWEILTATSTRMSFRTRNGEAGPWQCAKSFLPTDKVFADTSGGRVVIYP